MRKSMEQPKEVKKEVKLDEAFALWKNKSQAGNDYLTGYDFNKNKLIGYINTDKKNPKQPDITVYSLDANGKQDKEVASLWANVSKNEKQYLTGMTDEKEKLVAFFDGKEKHPYIRAYFKEEE